MRAGNSPSSARSDAQLMAALQEGDLDALEQLFRRHHPAIRLYLRRMTGGAAAEVEDAAQEVFLRVLRYAGSYDPRQSLAAWLYRIARNTLADQLEWPRRRVGSDAAMEQESATSRGAARGLERSEERAQVRRALAGLSPEQREAIILSRYHDLSYAEIGSIVGCTAEAVKGRVFRGVQRLATLLAGKEQVK